MALVAQAQSRKTGRTLSCPICGKEFYRKKSILDKMKDISHATCSLECMYEHRKELYKGENNHQYGKKGALNSSWKSDEKFKIYKFKRVLNHPFRDKSDMVPVYRLVADKYLTNDKNSVIINGERYLKKECVVHHIDFDKQNDNPENLYVFENAHMHTLYHNLYSNRVNSIEEFEKYYEDKYTNKILNYNWLYVAYVIYGLSASKISELFDIPCKPIDKQIKIFDLKKEKQDKEKRDIELIKNKLEQFSQDLKNYDIEEYTYDELMEIGSERGTGGYGSSGK